MENSSVTIVGEDPTVVDILSTALFSLPAEEIVDYINRRDQFETMVISSDGTTTYSTGFKNELQK